VPTNKFPNLRLTLITAQCYTLSPPQDTSSLSGDACSHVVGRTVEAVVKAVGEVCVKFADGCGASPDWERHVKPDAWSVNADCVCTTGDECGIEADGEDNEHVKADGGGGDDDINIEGDSCVLLEFILGAETVGIGDAKVAACLCSDDRDPVSGEMGW
jgi:hypothetical protein